MLVDNFVKQGLLQPWSIKSITAARDKFWIVRDFCPTTAYGAPLQKVVGCCALFPIGKDLLELRCVAVKESYAGRGVAKLLIEKMIRLATREKKNIFCFSRRSSFFENLGFFIVERKDLKLDPALDERYALDRSALGIKIYFYAPKENSA